jgi:hypothetical protein
MAVKTGIGKMRTAKSVMTLTGTDARYSVIRGIHFPTGAKT